MQFLTLLLFCLTAAVAAEFVEVPSSQDVVENSNLTVRCVHNGAASITWVMNGGVISDNSPNFRITESRDGAVLSSTLTMDPVSHAVHTGSYMCVAALSGDGETTNFTITVIYLADTILIRQVPDDCATRDDKIVASSTIILECIPPDAYPVANISWFKDDMKLRQRNISNIVFDNGKRYITITNIQLMDAGDYHCRANNELGERRSDVLRILVMVVDPATVSIFDSNKILYAREFDRAKIVCRITPTPDPQSVRWFHIPSDTAIVSGENHYVLWPNLCNYTLQINNVTTDHNGAYRCRLNPSGIDDTRTLKIARLSREYEVQLDPSTPLGISSSVTLRCAPTESTASEENIDPTYGWTFMPREGGNAVPVTSEEERVTVSEGTLEISPTQESDSGMYTCEVSHPLVATSLTASVNLTIAPPSACIETNSLSVMLNTNVTLRCIGTSQHTLQFVWTFSNHVNPIPTNSPAYSILTSNSSSNLTINNIMEQGLGTYFCSVSDTLSPPVSVNVTLMETEGLYLLGGVSYMTVNVPNGTVMELECPIRRGIGNITVGWFLAMGSDLELHDGENGVEIRSRSSGSSVLEIGPILLANESVYFCAASDEENNFVSVVFNVTVTLPVDIVRSPPPYVNGTEGQRIQFNCEVTGRPTPTVRWVHNAQNIQDLNDDRVSNLGNGTLVIEPLAREHAGTYYCAVQGDDNNLIIKEFRLQVLSQTDTGPTTDDQSSDSGFHFGSLNSNESILLVTVCSVVIVLLVLSLLVLLSLLGCWCWFLRQKRTYEVTMEEENGEFKRQASGRGSLRKDNSGVLVQSASTNYFGDAIDMALPSEYNSYGDHSHLPSLPLTPFGQGSIISEPLQHSPTPPAPSPIPHGTLGTTSLYSAEDEHSFAANLPNFPRANLRLKEEMGEGEFGPVYRGLAKNILPNEETTQVAVKVLLLRGGGEGEEHLRPDLALLDFANQMKLEYSNIATILGMCTDMEPYYIIYEYLDQGDLKKFLMNSQPTLSEEEPPKLTQQNLRRIILHVADGMAYLFSQRIIHGDLATRNCLISSDLRVKIADLGIGHDLYSGDYYDNGAQLLPIRWMPPELLVSCDEGPSFSLHSDIWSFGVFCWEVFTFARLPYEDLEDLQVLEMVPKGELLPFPPEGCPPPLYSIMEECWRGTPDERPRFAKLCVEIIDLELD